MTVLLVPFLGGLAGSLHCVGMCGVFPLALSQSDHPVLRQALYNLGRLNALALIGVLSGALGAGIVAHAPFRLGAQWLALAAGAVMVVVGLEMLGLLGALSARGAALAQATVGRAVAGVLRSGSLAGPLALGVFNAFLPCQLVYAFAAQAASTGSPGGGLLTMLAFGLGTAPAMLAVGLARTLARPAVRLRLQRVAAVLVVVLGVLTMLRGTGLLNRWHGPHAAASATSTIKPAVSTSLSSASTPLAARTRITLADPLRYSAQTTAGGMTAYDTASRQKWPSRRWLHSGPPTATKSPIEIPRMPRNWPRVSPSGVQGPRAGSGPTRAMRGRSMTPGGTTAFA